MGAGDDSVRDVSLGFIPSPGLLSPPLLTVISLCRDNPQDLAFTLEAMPAAASGLTLPWELLVLDGSDRSACQAVALARASRLALPLRYEQRPPRGIYVAMNEALSLARGRVLAFMHSGDRYLPGGLTALVQHWLLRGEPPVVFGQAWIKPAEGFRPWLTPDPSMRRLDRWLLAMVPCHQAFLFEGNFARHNPYARGSLVADRSVMRAGLALAGPQAYLPQPVCEFALSGASSGLPDRSELLKRLLDPQRSLFERAAELMKGLLRPLLGSSYPRLMRCRSKLWGVLCH